MPSVVILLVLRLVVDGLLFVLVTPNLETAEDVPLGDSTTKCLRPSVHRSCDAHVAELCSILR